MNKYDKYSSGRVTYSCNGAYEHYVPKRSKRTKVINIYLIDVILFVSVILGLLLVVAKF